MFVVVESGCGLGAGRPAGGLHGADGGSAGVADEWPELGPGADERFHGVSGPSSLGGHDLKGVAHRGCIEKTEGIEVGGSECVHPQKLPQGRHTLKRRSETGQRGWNEIRLGS